MKTQVASSDTGRKAHNLQHFLGGPDERGRMASTTLQKDKHKGWSNFLTSRHY
jgi:hypothetical protein